MSLIHGRAAYAAAVAGGHFYKAFGQLALGNVPERILTVLHTVNRILGGLVGILDGLVVVYFLTAIVIIVVPIVTGGAISYFEFGVMAEDTMLFKLFYDHNIVTGILNSIPSIF